MAATASTPPRRRLELPSAIVWVALAGVLLLTAAVILYLGRSTTFYFDEWNFVLERRAWDVDALLKPHNEHLSVVPVLIYKALFSTLGIDAYAPYRVAGVVVHLIVLVLLFVYARRRVGDVLALGVTVLIAVFGPAWPDVLWPFQAGFLGSLAAGIGALLCLDRGDRRGDIGASALLAVSLASSSLGIPICAAVALEILGRPDRGRRWWILAAPAVLYGIWYLAYGGGGKESLDNLLATPAYVVDAAAAATGSVFGLSIEWGRPLVLALGALLVLAIRRGAKDPWRLAALIALPLIFWGLTGLARADLHEPGAPRYLYPGAIFLLLIALEAARSVRITRAATLALLVVIVFATVSNLGALRNGAGFLRDQAAELNGVLAATQLAGRSAPAGVPPPAGAGAADRRRPVSRRRQGRRLARARAGPAAAAVRPRPRRRRRHADERLRDRAHARHRQAHGPGAAGRERRGRGDDRARRLPARTAAIGERGGRRRHPAERAPARRQREGLPPPLRRHVPPDRARRRRPGSAGDPQGPRRRLHRALARPARAGGPDAHLRAVGVRGGVRAKVNGWLGGSGCEPPRTPRESARWRPYPIEVTFVAAGGTNVISTTHTVVDLTLVAPGPVRTRFLPSQSLTFGGAAADAAKDQPPFDPARRARYIAR